MDLVERIKHFFGKEKPKVEILEIREHAGHFGYSPGQAVDCHLSNGAVITVSRYPILPQEGIHYKKEYIKPTVTRNEPLTNITF